MGLKRAVSAHSVRTPQPENISGVIKVAATASARSSAAMPLAMAQAFEERHGVTDIFGEDVGPPLSGGSRVSE